MEFLHIDLKQLFEHIGVWAAFGIIFAESGLLIGFFLPGDSLLFTAGLLASQDVIHLWYFLIGGTIAAILGDNVGYYFGKRFGSRIFKKEDSFFFHKDHIQRAKDFYNKYGAATVIIARFTPVVRTFAPILAGVGDMEYRKFFFYNVVGGIFWVFSVTLAGFYLGRLVPDIDKFILPIVGAIIIFSILPGIIAYFRSRAKKSA